MGSEEEAEERARAFAGYQVTPELVALAAPDAIVMHPLPRIGEIKPEVDSDRRAAYFRQAQNGLYIRMALLKMLLCSE